MTTFAGEPIFESGPHRLERAAEGTVHVPDLSLGNVSPTTVLVGPCELWLVVRGRLAGQTETEMALAIAALRAKVTDPPTEGLIVDSQGNEFEKMMLVSFETTGPMQRGRAVSVGYVARFLSAP